MTTQSPAAAQTSSRAVGLEARICRWRSAIGHDVEMRHRGITRWWDEDQGFGVITSSDFDGDFGSTSP